MRWSLSLPIRWRRGHWLLQRLLTLLFEDFCKTEKDIYLLFSHHTYPHITFLVYVFKLNQVYDFIFFVFAWCIFLSLFFLFILFLSLFVQLFWYHVSFLPRGYFLWIQFHLISSFLNGIWYVKKVSELQWCSSKLKLLIIKMNEMKLISECSITWPTRDGIFMKDKVVL